MREIASRITDEFKAGSHCAGHRHRNAYIAIVMAGNYIEYSVDGRYVCRPGNAVIHPAYHFHGNTFGDNDGRVLNITLPAQWADEIGYTILSGIHPAYDHEIDWIELANAARREDAIAPPQWLTDFVSHLFSGCEVSLSARKSGVTTEHAIRVCRRWFGLTPTQLRRESRIQQAIILLRSGESPVNVANDVGFSDQSHLTRVLKAAINMTPLRLQA